jgi:hypothetical protein
MANSTLPRTSSSTSIDSIESDVELISRYDIVGERITPFDPHNLGFRDNTITFFSSLNYGVSSVMSQESDPTSAKSSYHTELDAFTSQESDPTSAKREYHARLIYDDIKVTYSMFPRYKRIKLTFVDFLVCTAYQNAAARFEA